MRSRPTVSIDLNKQNFGMDEQNPGQGSTRLWDVASGCPMEGTMGAPLTPVSGEKLLNGGRKVIARLLSTVAILATVATAANAAEFKVTSRSDGHVVEIVGDILPDDDAKFRWMLETNRVQK